MKRWGLLMAAQEISRSLLILLSIKSEMRHVRRIAIGLGIIVGLVVLSLAVGPGTSESKNRKIAAGLVELHRQWETNADIPSLFQSLTNLPFQSGAVGVGKGWVHRRHEVLGIKWEECYFIYQPSPATNASEETT